MALDDDDGDDDDGDYDDDDLLLRGHQVQLVMCPQEYERDGLDAREVGEVCQ